MGMIRTSIIASVTVATSASAQDLNLSCKGENWSLELNDQSAELIFPSPTQMDVMLDTPAEGHEWPRALTLVGDRDSGVLILDQRQCGSHDIAAELLTQRGQTPIFVIGCCSVRE